MRRIEKLLPGLTPILDYDRSWLGRDLLAGVSVAAVAVPVGIAYSHLASVPPVHGLYASILPLVAYALFWFLAASDHGAGPGDLRDRRGHLDSARRRDINKTAEQIVKYEQQIN